MRTLNLGILAHVDAGKTTLTERLLHNSGVIDELGSVDAGNTQTDTLALERQRGITIKSAVVSFTAGDVTVNLIDTPGHPDFIAEVERVLAVLDGAVLVVSAVEGVQAQTRVLMRALQRLRIPTIVFANKTDRRGADPARVLREIAEKLSPAAVGWDDDRRLAEVLADRDDALLEAYVENGATLPRARLRGALAAQTRQARVHPVFFGSARTGAGVEALVDGITELLPAAEGDGDGAPAGTVFKIERGTARGEGRLRPDVLRRGAHARPSRRRQGDRHQRLRGRRVRPPRRGRRGRDRQAVGPRGRPHRRRDRRRATAADEHWFAPPTLETVVVPRTPADRRALRVALDQLAEQDPLIGLRQDDARQELSVSLYGEVQKEVIQATLAADFGVDVTFRESTTICIERPAGSGAAFEIIGTDGNPFLATVGLRVDPAPVGSGVSFGLEVELGSMPLSFFTAVEETVRATLEPGPVRLAGGRLRGDDDPLRLLGEAEPLARDVRQEHVEHGARLPPADPARADGRAAPGPHAGARAGAPLRARAAGGRARPGAAGDRAARRRAGQPGAARRDLHARRRRPGRARARAAPAAAGPDPRRGAARHGVSIATSRSAALLPAGSRTDDDPLDREEYIRRVTGRRGR